ncbi:hypothetical protein ACE38W_01135 [Chitinophaga sp. Hz27]|uniref:hypothetical protein n=1 Tax=Chitinophaga sp. Hz27 TaxID=3347169 RepID=UPI0035E07977
MYTRKKEAQRVVPLIDELEHALGLQLPPAVRKKAITCHSIFVPMVCDLFTALHGRTTTEEEKNSIFYYFICSGLFDDFADDKTLTAAQLREIMLHPASYQCNTPEEKIFVYTGLRLNSVVRNKASYEQVLKQLLTAQLDSGKQFDPAISNSELEEITFSKGGNSLQLVYYYLNIPTTAEERHCWFLLGAIIQLTNDLYDIYKDLQAGIQTLPNRMKSAIDFQQYFNSVVSKLENHLHKLPYKHKRKHAFHLGLASICSFGNTALEHLIELQAASDKLPALHTLPRKSLIIDMEKPRNIWRCMKYSYLRTSYALQETKPIVLPVQNLSYEEHVA